MSTEGPWRCQHNAPGSFDESARRVGHPELKVAELLVREGHHVRSLVDGVGPGRTPDFSACGVTVEVKTFRSLDERRGHLPDAVKVANKIVDGSGQGAVVFVLGGESGLSEGAARSGYMLFCQHALDKGLGKARSVRVVGEGFDLVFDPVTDLRAASKARSEVTASPGHAGLTARVAPRRQGPHV